MDARADQAANVPVVPSVGAQASAVAPPRAVDWRRQAAGVLAVVVALATGLALVPPFAADLARRNAIAAANVAYLDDAEAHLLRAISWTPQDAYLHQFLGQVYYRKALFRPQQRRVYLDKALAAFERSARLNPHEAETFTLEGG